MLNQTNTRDAGIYHSLTMKAAPIFSILSLYEIVIFNITQINILRQRMQWYLHSHQVNLMWMEWVFQRQERYVPISALSWNGAAALQWGRQNTLCHTVAQVSGLNPCKQKSLCTILLWHKSCLMFSWKKLSHSWFACKYLPVGFPRKQEELCACVRVHVRACACVGGRQRCYLQIGNYL